MIDASFPAATAAAAAARRLDDDNKRMRRRQNSEHCTVQMSRRYDIETIQLKLTMATLSLPVCP